MAEKSEQIGRVVGIAYRPSSGMPMTEVAECAIEASRGLMQEERASRKRQVSLLSRESWSATCAELGVELPWPVRRANLLTTGIDLAACIGTTLIIGVIEIEVTKETRPCALMDEQHEGLRAALVPDGRGGVCAKVIVGGTVRVGDAVAAR